MSTQNNFITYMKNLILFIFFRKRTLYLVSGLLPSSDLLFKRFENMKNKKFRFMNPDRKKTIDRFLYYLDLDL